MLMYVSLIILVNVIAGLGAYAFITIKELKSSRAMWQQAYTSLSIQTELDKWKLEIEKSYNR
jgi:hypothetical protein